MHTLSQRQFLSSAIFAAIIQLSTSVWATENTVVAEPAPETLPDGNLRDPMPSPEVLSNFAKQSLKNMVLFDGATFQMGDWGAEVNKEGLPFDGSMDSKPLHKVKLSRFSIAKYPVTYAEFDIFTAALRLPRVNQQTNVQKYRKPNNPADVTWQGAKAYCNWLGKLINKTIDLPSEAQWEFSARSGGKRHIYPTDNGQLDIGRNLPSYEQKKAAGGLVSVNDFPPNQAGIYYMSAGVHEWVNDWYSDIYYQNSPIDNPKGPSTGSEHVLRGDFGYSGSAMTFKRWHWPSEEQVGTWTKYGKNRGESNKEIPKTKYSNVSGSAFRCALN
jgi:sulfatase modifying factor 1